LSYPISLEVSVQVMRVHLRSLEEGERSGGSSTQRQARMGPGVPPPVAAPHDPDARTPSSPDGKRQVRPRTAGNSMAAHLPPEMVKNLLRDSRR